MIGMKIPTLRQANQLLEEATVLNNTPWVEHSKYVAKAAKYIADKSGMDKERAYIFGLLHDIGRREGRYHFRHITDGYYYLKSLGFDDAARICLTHCFPYKNIESYFGEFDCKVEEKEFVKDYINGVEYDDYDRLIQLCDGIALSTGFILLEKRMVDAVLRLGSNDLIVPKWRATQDLLNYFDNKVGCSVYSLLPGVMENTFGF
jgi:putative nucleotidyltransferase with HDIG domain